MNRESLINCISTDELEKVFNTLINFETDNVLFQQQVVLVRAQYYNLEHNIRLGILSSEEAQLRRNQVRHKLLEIITVDNTIETNSNDTRLDEYFPNSNNEKLEFSLTLDLPVARSMRPLNGFENFLMLFQSLFDKSPQSDVDDGHVTRNFDWDGTYVWTPCDCKLAVNTWAINSGNHLSYINQNNESKATLIAKKCGYGSVFGNGFHLYCSSMNSIIQEIESELMPFDIYSLVVAKNSGKEMVSILTKDSQLKLGIFLRDAASKPFKYHQFEIKSEYISDNYSSNWNVKLIEDSDWRKSYTLLYGTTNNNELEKDRDLMLIDLYNDKILAHQTLSGVQDVDLHPNRHKIVVLGKRLSILNRENLKVEVKTLLPTTRPPHEKGVVAFSRCGRFISVSYNASGDIEIRDAERLNLLHSFSGYGKPFSDISWDITGRFLACRYKNRESRRRYLLIIWDLMAKKEILKTEASEVEFSNYGLMWSEYSTSIGFLVNKSRVQIYELRKN
jgi:hypothetical protein